MVCNSLWGLTVRWKPTVSVSITVIIKHMFQLACLIVLWRLSVIQMYDNKDMSHPNCLPPPFFFSFFLLFLFLNVGIRDTSDLFLREASHRATCPNCFQCSVYQDYNAVSGLKKGVSVGIEVLWEGANELRQIHTKHESVRFSIYQTHLSLSLT